MLSPGRRNENVYTFQSYPLFAVGRRVLVSLGAVTALRSPGRGVHSPVWLRVFVHSLLLSRVSKGAGTTPIGRTPSGDVQKR